LTIPNAALNAANSASITVVLGVKNPQRRRYGWQRAGG
jgi:hypothetical protein